MEKNSEGSGIVQFGEVNSQGMWRSVQGQLEIEFDTGCLNHNHLRALETYRSSSLPLQLRLPGEKSRLAVVIGFERSNRAAKFYISSDN
jgi:hypothetical protein